MMNKIAVIIASYFLWTSCSPSVLTTDEALEEVKLLREELCPNGDQWGPPIYEVLFEGPRIIVVHVSPCANVEKFTGLNFTATIKGGDMTVVYDKLKKEALDLEIGK